MKVKELRTLTIKEAVETLGDYGLVISEETLRDGIECGAFPFGICVINPDVDTRRRQFFIFTAQLHRWIAERLEETDYPDWFFKGGEETLTDC